MGHTLTKKVRLDAAYAGRLARLAKTMDATESDVIRKGIDLVDQMTNREKALEWLIEMAAIKGPDKERYSFK